METTLRDLAGEYAEVMAMVNDPDVDRQVVIDTLEGIEGELEVKAQGYGMVMRNIKFEIAGLTAKEKYLKDLTAQVKREKDRLQGHYDGMEDRMTAALIATGLDEKGIDAGEFGFKLVNAGGDRALEIVGEVPQEYMKVTVEPDNAKIKEYLKDNTCKWARLLPRKKVLKVKGV